MTILVATDFAHNSPTVVKYAHALAEARGETLALMHVIDFTADDNAWRVLYSAPDELEVQARETAKEKLGELYDEQIGDGATFERVIEFGEPAEAILAVSRREDISMVVVGTVGQSRLQEIFFGHTPSRLVRECEVPVVAVPPDYKHDAIERVLAPVDFSEFSRTSLTLAAEFAEARGASLEVLNAFETPTPPPFLGLPAIADDVRIKEITDARMGQLSEFVEAVGVAEQVSEQWVVGTRPADAIAQIGEDRDIDLVVMGTAGREGVARFFLGSTAERVLRNTKRPVMVIGTRD
jgi:nucleotide-binding universal stress UspA family protein